MQPQRIEVEESLNQLSRYMDGLFRVPGIGWKFGLDALVGFIPGAGDIATSLVSFYILIAAVRYRVPKITLLRMALNIAIDYLLGVIPLVGDVLDFAWRSNKMNMELLRTRAAVSADEAKHGRASDWLFVLGLLVILIGLLLGSIALGAFLLYYVLKNTPLI